MCYYVHGLSGGSDGISCGNRTEKKWDNWQTQVCYVQKPTNQPTNQPTNPPKKGTMNVIFLFRQALFVFWWNEAKLLGLFGSCFQELFYVLENKKLVWGRACVLFFVFFVFFVFSKTTFLRTIKRCFHCFFNVQCMDCFSCFLFLLCVVSYLLFMFLQR